MSQRVPESLPGPSVKTCALGPTETKDTRFPDSEFLGGKKQYFLFRAVPKVWSLPQTRSLQGDMDHPKAEKILGPSR